MNTFKAPTSRTRIKYIFLIKIRELYKVARLCLSNITSFEPVFNAEACRLGISYLTMLAKIDNDIESFMEVFMSLASIS